MIVIDSVIKPVIQKKPPRKIFQYTKANWDKAREDAGTFKDTFLASDWKNQSVDYNWTLFKEQVLGTISRNVPSKMSSTRTNVPWLTPPLRKLINRKNKLYYKARKSRQPQLWAKYKCVKRDTQKALRKAEWTYMNEILTDGLSSNDNKPFWRYIKAKRQDTIGVAPLLQHGTLHNDSQAKARILNEQFESVFTKGEVLPNLPALGGNPSPNIPELSVDVRGTHKLLTQLKINKASGPDGLPNRVLRELADQLAPVLAAIFQQSLVTHSLPEDWRNANVTPIYKKGDRHKAVNYRPVSLTCVCCKLLEHIVCSHIHKHLENHSILSSIQHGFRKRHSCESQLLITLHDLMSYFDQKVTVDVAILDLSKAFDTVPHDKLLHKLSHYGIHGDVHSWIEHFLIGRHQRVVVDGEHSSNIRVASGVPQGTVLGPLLFLLFINDLPSVVKSQVRLFADDCLIYRPIRKPEDQIALDQDLAALSRWADTWGMVYNPQKCFVMTITHSKNPPQHFYSLCGCVLSQVRDTKYLGITISSDLQWDRHITATTAKANRMIGFLRRNLSRCPRQLRELAYITLIRSRVEYGAVVWDPYLAKDVQSIEAVQRKTARFVCKNFQRTASVTDMINTLGWDTLESRREKARLKQLNKIIGGRVAIPHEEYLTPNNTRTRSISSTKFKHYRARTLIFKNSFFPRTIPVWNRTPDSVISDLEIEGQIVTTRD